jgi:hypothetical protein
LSKFQIFRFVVVTGCGDGERLTCFCAANASKNLFHERNPPASARVIERHVRPKGWPVLNIAALRLRERRIVVKFETHTNELLAC